IVNEGERVELSRYQTERGWKPADERIHCSAIYFDVGEKGGATRTVGNNLQSSRGIPRELDRDIQVRCMFERWLQLRPNSADPTVGTEEIHEDIQEMDAKLPEQIFAFLLVPQPRSIAEYQWSMVSNVYFYDFSKSAILLRLLESLNKVAITIIENNA